MKRMRATSSPQSRLCSKDTRDAAWWRAQSSSAVIGIERALQRRYGKASRRISARVRVTTLASIRAMQQVVDRSASTSVTAADIGAMARQVFRDGPAFTRFLQHHRHRIAPIERLIALVPPRCDILDVGCGGGLLVACLTICGRVRRAHGVDSSSAAIANAQAAAKRLASMVPDAELLFECRDVEAGLPDGEFDVVALIDVLHHVPPTAQKQAFLQAMTRVRRGGMFLYKDMCDAPWWRAGLNRMHDLALAQQWIHYVPIEAADQWATEAGFRIECAQSHTRLWYGHELRVYRRPLHDA